LKIINEFPPNIQAIKNVFPITGKETFSWGDIVYNPSGDKLSKSLLAHERVHGIQQGDDIEGWWARYLIDTEFRFTQELEAHRVEYLVFISDEPNRNRRRILLKQISKRLSSRMYGSMVTFEKARKLIKK